MHSRMLVARSNSLEPTLVLRATAFSRLRAIYSHSLRTTAFALLRATAFATRIDQYQLHSILPARSHTCIRTVIDDNPIPHLLSSESSGA